MDVVLIPAEPTAEALLQRLAQLYIYDLGDVYPGALEVNDDGLFVAGTSIASCWIEPWRKPFVIRADGNVAGFCILDRRSRLTGDPAVSDVAEFFVLRRYRRHGVGMRAAHLAFDRFPGAWEVRERSWNTAATAFWRRAIGAYAAYTEQVLDDDRWTGPVQSFG